MLTMVVIVVVVVILRWCKEPESEPENVSSLPDFIGHMFEWKKYAALSKMAGADGRLGAAAKSELQTREFFLKLSMASKWGQPTDQQVIKQVEEICQLVDEYPDVAVSAMLEGQTVEQFLSAIRQRAGSVGSGRSLG